MIVERRYSNRFVEGEEAHAFEQHVKGAAIEAGLSVGPCGVEEMGWLGSDAHLSLSGDGAALDRFAAQLHQGVRLVSADRESDRM